MSPEPTGVPDSATQVPMPSAAPMWWNMVSPAIPVARRSGRHCQHRGGGEGRQDQAHTGAPDQHPGQVLSDVVRLAGRPPSLSQRVPLMHPQQAEQPEVQEPVRKLGAVRNGRAYRDHANAKARAVGLHPVGTSRAARGDAYARPRVRRAELRCCWSSNSEADRVTATRLLLPRRGSAPHGSDRAVLLPQIAHSDSAPPGLQRHSPAGHVRCLTGRGHGWAQTCRVGR